MLWTLGGDWKSIWQRWIGRFGDKGEISENCSSLPGTSPAIQVLAEKFAQNGKTPLEKVEDIELLRALEIGLKIKSINLNGDSFSVDVPEDFEKANEVMITDKFFKLYK